MIHVEKRDGRIVDFDRDKIETALCKSYLASHSEVDLDFKGYVEKVSGSIEDTLQSTTTPVSVETIQDMVEKKLMTSRYKGTAKDYILYRDKRTRARKNTIDDTVKEIIDGTSDYWSGENSNKDFHLVTTQRDYIAGAVSTDLTMRELLPDEVVEAHKEGILHFHDADYFITRLHNCSLINLEDMLENGTVISNVKIDRPHKFSTACNIATQIISQVASSQYGGQSITLSHLSPFIEVTRATLRKKFPTFSDDQIEQLVKSDISAGVQTLQYQIITLMTTNGQAPFITVYLDLSEVPEGVERDDLAIAIEEVLRQRIQGVKNRQGVYITPAFPKLIYALDDCNIHEDSKYWYLTKLAAECSAKRMVPDYISNKVQRKLKNGDEYPCMGALIGTSLVDIKIHDDVYENIPIKKAYGLINQCLRSYYQFCGHDKVKKNKICGVYRLVHVPTGLFYIGSSTDIYRRFREHKYSYLHKGTLGDNYIIDDYDLSNLQFDILETCEMDDMYSLESKYYKNLNSDLCVNFKDPIDRGNFRKGTDDSIKSMNGISYSTFNHKWNGTMVKEIPSYTGIYIKSGYQWVPIRYIQYNNDKCPLQLYRVFYRVNGKLRSITGTQDHPLETNRGRVYLEDLTIGDTLKDIYGNDVVISNIERVDTKYRTYDFTTDNDMFNVNGIISHNCRSFLTPDRTTQNYAKALNWDKVKGHKYYGRFNQGVVTINLPDVALTVDREIKEGKVDSSKKMERFWDVLQERLELCHKALQCRHKRLEGTVSDIAPIQWQNGALARLEKGETIDELLHHGYSTISLGYAGLYECTKVMTGVSHTNPKGKDFALSVMKALNDACQTWKKAEDVDYSVYGTPLESTTYKFAKCLRERFGRIKGVTDHDYITNSYHTCVREPIDAFTKLKLESEFQQLSPGGAISYVEVPNMSHNIPAVLDILKFIYDNIMYAEINSKFDYCQVCGYTGEIQIKGEEGHLYWECPNCGNTDQSKMNVARRTCGYIGTNFWNQGRTEEIRDRVLHLDTLEKL